MALTVVLKIPTSFQNHNLKHYLGNMESSGKKSHPARLSRGSTSAPLGCVASHVAARIPLAQAGSGAVRHPLSILGQRARRVLLTRDRFLSGLLGVLTVRLSPSCGCRGSPLG